MDLLRLYDQQSPGSCSSTTNQDTPAVLKISYRLLLNLLLQKLGAPEAECRVEFCEDNQVQFTVRFSTSAPTLEEPAIYNTISGNKSKDYEIAEDTAYFQAITYVQMTTNMVMRDFNYPGLKLLEEENRALLHQLDQSNEAKKKLARGWFLAVRHMSSFSQQILSIVYLNHSKEEGQVDKTWNTLLVNFQDMGFKLQHAGKTMEKFLEKWRMRSFA